ncbi:MAG TPA: heparan-alpha-glucosaminide N-acetyltransferase domain-containing protein [Bacteroidota bacterium]|nr:heparan-alpha-glucosaminide N-acetyltransferase domain-containing protein [Bacteroidota bacterium]
MRIGSSPQRPEVLEVLPPERSVMELPPPGAASLHMPPRTRLDSIDLLRGLVMVIMALDHVRDYFTNVRFDPLDLTQTTGALAFTRLVTHFCAPVFVFLAGTGAYLSLSRGKSRGQLAKFLLTRGLWLIVLELTVVRLGWEFNFNYSLAFVQVIWAIGWSMIALAALVFLPLRIAGLIGVAMIVTHNLTDSVDPGRLGIFGWPWQVLHAGGFIPYAPGRLFLVAYPLIPWIGVMAAGFAFGEVFKTDAEKRKRLLYGIGGCMVLLFVALRSWNIYGDPTPWSVQATGILSVVSFLNCQKYPPSLLYLLMTLGPAIALLPLLEKWKGKTAGFFLVYGRVPMFYYILHLFLFHTLALATAALMGFDTGFLFGNPFGSRWPDAWGFGLAGVYAFWALTVLLLYPLCRWFSLLKQRRKDAWLSYL